MTLSERDRLLTLLFEESNGKELVNIKFFRGRAATTEDLCAAARRAIMSLGPRGDNLMDVPPASHRSQASVAELLAKP